MIVTDGFSKMAGSLVDYLPGEEGELLNFLISVISLVAFDIIEFPFRALSGYLLATLRSQWQPVPSGELKQ